MGWTRIFGEGLAIESEILLLSLTVKEVALFLSVWIIYLFDRIYDVGKNGPYENLPLRHQFAKRHQKLLIAILLIALIFLALLIPSFTPEVWLLGVVVGVGVGFYFLFFRFELRRRKKANGRTYSRFPRKEAAIALFFSLGVWGASGTPWELFHPVVAYTFALLLLVLANCLLIASAERSHDERCDPASFVSQNPTTKKWISAALGIASTTAILTLIFHPDTLITCSLLLAAAALKLIQNARISNSLKPALADLAMLIPWIVLAGQALSSRG